MNYAYLISIARQNWCLQKCAKTTRMAKYLSTADGAIFEFGSHNLWIELFDSINDVSPEERVRRRIDLAVVSVLIDAGAGPSWRYTDHPPD